MSAFPRIGAASASLLAGGLAFLALAGLESCAHVEAPPGGPPDSIPPILVGVTPDSFAVVPGLDDWVRFEFNETISEQNIQMAAMLYPFEARPKIGKGKRELRVQPRAGWVPDRIYHIRVEPVSIKDRQAAHPRKMEPPSIDTERAMARFRKKVS